MAKWLSRPICCRTSMRSAPIAFIAARRYSFIAAATRVASAGATSTYTRRLVAAGMGGAAAVCPNAGAMGSINDTTANTKRNIRSLRFSACEYTQVRLFVAVEIGERLSQRVAEVSRELQRRAAEAAPRAKVSWVASGRLHLTVRFIGEVDDERAAMVGKVFEVP